MNRKLFTAAITVIIIGVVLCSVAYLTGAGRSGDGLSGERIEFEKMNLEEFKNIDVVAVNSEIKVEVGDSYGIEYTFSDGNRSHPEYKIENGKLSFNENHTRILQFFSFNFNFEPNYVTVYVPKNTDLSDIKITTSNGKITVQDVIAKDIKLKTSNGTFTLSDVKAQMLDLQTSNGKMNLTNVTALKSDLKTSNGEISVRDSSFTSSSFDTSNGRIYFAGTLYKENDFHTSNGSIDIDLKNSKQDFDYELKTSNGKIYLDSEEKGKYTEINNGKENSITAKTSNSSLYLKFSK